MAPPRLILIDRALPDMDLIAEALGTRVDGRVVVRVPRRGQGAPHLRG
ncbi:MAG: hypothetical protein ACK4YX_10580 [Rhabdaerophilum calidifontis]